MLKEFSIDLVQNHEDRETVFSSLEISPRKLRLGTHRDFEFSSNQDTQRNAK